MADITKIQETFVERKDDEHSYIIGESEWYEPFTSDRGRLFRSLQKEYGRCVSKQYCDDKAGRTHTTGWVFERREQYEDTGRYGRPAQYYTREVWVSIAPDAWFGGL